jgi:hypothetical protein
LKNDKDFVTVESFNSQGEQVGFGDGGRRASDLVFGFDKPHRPGTICGFHCEQCGGQQTWATGINGEKLPEDQALFIVAEATEEDWRQSVKAHGGRWQEPTAHGTLFYFVRTD